MSLKKQQSSSRRLTGISILKRNLAENNIQRARNPVTPSRMTVRGQFPSKKMQRMVAWESQLERRACYLFEFTPEIVSFREQPERFHIPFKNKIKRYTPDFEVVNKLGEVSYWEIKPLRKLLELKDYFNFMSAYFLKRGLGFFVLTEEELMNPFREKNLTLLRQYQTVVLTNEMLLVLRDFYLKRDYRPLKIEVLEELFGKNIIYSALGNDYLSCDLNQEIVADTPVFLNLSKGDTYDISLFSYRTAPYF